MRRVAILIMSILLIGVVMSACGGLSPEEGWCCWDGGVFSSSESECTERGGQFFTNQEDAQEYCQGEGEELPPIEPILPPSPDLVISAIEVLPEEPTAGVFFALNIYVSNEGQAVSGDYDIAINIEDISRGLTYPIGTFRKSKMYPGENYCVYSSTERLVNEPGDHQVNVEIRPLFEDGDTSNNSESKYFTAK